jgi:hypothetical protein
MCAHLVQLLHHLVLLLVPVHGEPLLELVAAAEHLGQQEVQQRPQLMQVVLQRRAGDQEPVAGAQHAQHLQRGGAGRKG